MDVPEVLQAAGVYDHRFPVFASFELASNEFLANPKPFLSAFPFRQTFSPAAKDYHVCEYGRDADYLTRFEIRNARAVMTLGKQEVEESVVPIWTLPFNHIYLRLYPVNRAEEVSISALKIIGGPKLHRRTTLHCGFRSCWACDGRAGTRLGAKPVVHARFFHMDLPGVLERAGVYDARFPVWAEATGRDFWVALVREHALVLATRRSWSFEGQAEYHVVRVSREADLWTRFEVSNARVVLVVCGQEMSDVAQRTVLPLFPLWWAALELRLYPATSDEKVCMSALHLYATHSFRNEIRLAPLKCGLPFTVRRGFMESDD